MPPSLTVSFVPAKISLTQTYPSGSSPVQTTSGMPTEGMESTSTGPAKRTVTATAKAVSASRRREPAKRATTRTTTRRALGSNCTRWSKGALLDTAGRLCTNIAVTRRADDTAKAAIGALRDRVLAFLVVMDVAIVIPDRDVYRCRMSIG